MGRDFFCRLNTLDSQTHELDGLRLFVDNRLALALALGYVDNGKIAISSRLFIREVLKALEVKRS